MKNMPIKKLLLVFAMSICTQSMAMDSIFNAPGQMFNALAALFASSFQQQEKFLAEPQSKKRSKSHRSTQNHIRRDVTTNAPSDDTPIGAQSLRMSLEDTKELRRQFALQDNPHLINATSSMTLELPPSPNKQYCKPSKEQVRRAYFETTAKSKPSAHPIIDDAYNAMINRLKRTEIRRNYIKAALQICPPAPTKIEDVKTNRDFFLLRYMQSVGNAKNKWH